MASYLSYLNPISWFSSAEIPAEQSPDYVKYPENEIQTFAVSLDKEIRILQSNVKKFSDEDRKKWKELVGVDYVFVTSWFNIQRPIEATYTYNNAAPTKFEAARTADLDSKRYHSILLKQKINSGVNGGNVSDAQMKQISDFFQSNLPTDLTWALKNPNGEAFLEKADIVLQQALPFDPAENTANDIEQGLRKFQEMAVEVEEKFAKFISEMPQEQVVNEKPPKKQKNNSVKPVLVNDTIFANLKTLSELACDRIRAMTNPNFEVVFFNMSLGSLINSKHRVFQVSAHPDGKVDLYHDVKPGHPFASLSQADRRKLIDSAKKYSSRKELLPSSAEFEIDASRDYSQGKGIYATVARYSLNKEGLTSMMVEESLTQLKESAIKCMAR